MTGFAGRAPRLAFGALIAIGVMATLTLTGVPVAAQDPSPSTRASAAPVASGLDSAIPFAAVGTTTILYTDWAAMKAAHGLADVTSTTPIDERVAAMLNLTRSEAPFAAFGLSHLRGHADAWGWDSSDLDWEASTQGHAPSVSVLHFRDGFDLAPVAAQFDARDFSSSDYGDAVIRSHDLKTGSAWIGTTNFGILNTAFLDDGRTLVLSSSLDALKAALDARLVMTYRAEPAAVVAGALGEPLSAGIEIGPDACRAYDPRGLPGDDHANDALLTEVGPLRAWEAMGIGTYRGADGSAGAGSGSANADVPASGRIAFAYDNQDAATADLEGRLRLGREGISLVAGKPYHDAVFTLTGGSVGSDVLAIDVAPVGDSPTRLRSALFARDLLLAACT
jgi:hypothetical protein